MDDIEKFFRFEVLEEENEKDLEKVCLDGQNLRLRKGLLFNEWLDGEFFGMAGEANGFNGIWVKRSNLKHEVNLEESERDWFIHHGMHKILNVEVVLKGKWIGPGLFKGYWLDWKARKIMKGIFVNRKLQGFGYLYQCQKKYTDDFKCIEELEGLSKSGKFHKKIFSVMKNHIRVTSKLSYKGYFSKGHFDGNGVLKIQTLKSLEHVLPISQDTHHFISSLQNPFPFVYTGYFTRGSFNKIGSYSFSESCIMGEFNFWMSPNPLFKSQFS